MVLHGFVSKSGIAAQPSVPGGQRGQPRAGTVPCAFAQAVAWTGVGRSGAVPPSRIEIASAASRAWAASSGDAARVVTRNAVPPDVDRGDHVAARVVDRGGHGVEISARYSPIAMAYPRRPDAGQLPRASGSSSTMVRSV